MDSLHDHSIVSGNNQYPYTGKNQGRGRGGIIHKATGGGVRGAPPSKLKGNLQGRTPVGQGRAQGSGLGLGRARGQGLFGSDDPVLSRVRRRLEEGNHIISKQHTYTHIHDIYNGHIYMTYT